MSVLTTAESSVTTSMPTLGPGTGVRLVGFQLDAFGALRDVRLDDVPPGLVVIHGPNAAGKSTLLAFVTRTLFGHPHGNRKGVNHYEPVDGSATRGGRLFLAADPPAGPSASITLERLSGRGSSFRVLLPDGSVGGDDTVRELTGGIDGDLFETVFAFGLDELRGLGRLGEESVRDRLLSAGTPVAGRRSARAASDTLDARLGELWRPRSRTLAIDAAQDELSRLDAELAQARRAAAEYPARVAEERVQAEEVARAGAAVDARELQERRAEGLRTRLAALDEQLRSRERARAALIERRETITASGDRLAGLLDEVLDLEAQRGAQQERLDRLAVVEENAAHAAEELGRALDELGPGWDRTRLDAFVATRPSRHELRSWERELLVADDEESSGANAPEAPPAKGRGRAGLALGATVATVIWLLASGAPGPAALVLLAALFGALAVWWSRRGQRSGNDVVTRDRAVAGSGTDGVGEAAAQPVSGGQRWAEWQAWARARHFDTGVDPVTAHDVLDQAERAGLHGTRLDVLASERSTLHERLLAFHERLTELLARADREVEGRARGGPTPLSVSEYRAALTAMAVLARDVRDDSDRRAQRRGLDEQIDDLGQQIGELAEERSGTARQLADVDTTDDPPRLELVEARDRALERLHQARGAREALENSARLAELQQEREAAVTERDRLVHEWRVCRLAQALIDETLDAYERERRPGVWRQAAAHLATVTGGGYRQLLRRDDQVLVTDADGRPWPVDTLSRGTAEQLYLCLRLALAEDLGTRGPRLPVVVDDVLVNFDPARAAGVADLLVAAARGTQVLCFTCHPHTVDLLLDAGAAAVYDLGPTGESLSRRDLGAPAPGSA